MEKKEMNETQKEEDMTLLLLRQMEKLRQEVRLAIEIAANASCKLMSVAEVCKAMNISPHTLHRYESMFRIPVRKVGNKKFYFEAEVKNCIITGLRFWKQ